MREDLDYHRRLFDGGDDLQLAGAPCAWRAGEVNQNVYSLKRFLAFGYDLRYCLCVGDVSQEMGTISR